MSENFQKVEEFVLELGFQIDEKIPADEILIVEDDDRGIHNLLIDCEDDVLVLEQLILKLDPQAQAEIYRRLLQINRTLVYGAFVLDEGGTHLLFRNTLALENLDLNELEGSINALSLALAENGDELLTFVNKDNSQSN
ncbi:MAG: molecular chaperone Tir [Candidatus Latescibacteria bacterium]|nr:molecular chaperone Tir [Candidatus Latescibacterota bacterium]